jgi:hypothetical protein
VSFVIHKPERIDVHNTHFISKNMNLLPRVKNKRDISTKFENYAG